MAITAVTEALSSSFPIRLPREPFLPVRSASMYHTLVMASGRTSSAVVASRRSMMPAPSRHADLCPENRKRVS